jgi:N-carbamoyl-L-amino-acid hydrolase
MNRGHIEQGPVLEAEKLPVGIVTGIPGNWRLPAARIIGKYDHSGGVPRAYRHDSVVAGADFIHALDELWREWDAAGRDMAYTVGKFYTDPQQHALTKISGEASFSLDVRSLNAQSLAQLESRSSRTQLRPAAACRSSLVRQHGRPSPLWRRRSARASRRARRSWRSQPA